MIQRILVLLFTVLSSAIFAQVSPDKDQIFDVEYIPTPTDTMVVFKYMEDGEVKQAAVIEGDTVRWMIMDEILLLDEPTFDSQEARKRYFYLKRKVMKVYPYAVLAADKLDSLNLRLDTLEGRRARRRYIREYNDFLETRFEPELRRFTHSEGQILCKLIYRETGIPVYDLISEYRSGWTAFWWNVTANWNDISLKQGFDPETIEEDKLIEQILLRAFSQGLLEERVPFYPPSK